MQFTQAHSGIVKPVWAQVAFSGLRLDTIESTVPGAEAVKAAGEASATPETLKP